MAQYEYQTLEYILFHKKAAQWQSALVYFEDLTLVSIRAFTFTVRGWQRTVESNIVRHKENFLINLRFKT